METRVLSPQVLELSKRDISQKLPVILKDKLLMAPGIHNGTNYTKEEVRFAFSNTDWTDKQNISLIADHADFTDKEGINHLSIHDFLGFVKNPRFDEATGEARGDLELHDLSTIQKLVVAKAKFGISPQVEGIEDAEGNFKDFVFKNFSVVTNPAIGEKAYINLSQNKYLEKIKELEKKIKELGATGSEDVKGDELELDSNKELKGGKCTEEMEAEKEKTKKEEAVEETKEESKEEPTEKPAEEETETKEMSAQDMFKELSAKIDKLTSVLVKRLSEEPEEKPEEKTEEEPKEESEDKIKEMEKKIKEMEAKLNEPDAKSVRELSATSQEASISMVGDGPSEGIRKMDEFLQRNFC